MPIPTKTVLIFGGSFDPVHSGHVEMVKHVAQRFSVDEVRLIPAGQPWQKAGLKASPAQRSDMLRLAFEGELSIPVQIDQQEVERAEQQIPSYTVDTLEQLRQYYGETTALILLIGADQFRNLTTWKNWQQLFQLAHIVAAARPGYSLQLDELPSEFVSLWGHAQNELDIARFKQCCFGKTWLETGLAWDISATRIRASLQQQGQSKESIALIPRKVLDYLQSHSIYN
ncbi:nicotinate (nicotinamide) nucleotide adenylyltransferase [Undibacterium cyanobacteriorum]|uniref:Probable nicotinate-nucleotide adenylyltransferase n=1 Tax=Undibacterium cyanobacteriorum TaxID=3073561 RepID=A0ABY9RLI9_9BURK|nr:nicotinate (nicotinamide) nucleotide adenylyltransferase [Undibacterium sp. 20NA77.5]WMW81564.1 nicotinate (nicotinamide) nucleotide adenylyltransferase [Undibacterium sp. 20NA77.5]